jgi:hypothetical protein
MFSNPPHTKGCVWFEHSIPTPSISIAWGWDCCLARRQAACQVAIQVLRVCLLLRLVPILNVFRSEDDTWKMEKICMAQELKVWNHGEMVELIKQDEGRSLTSWALGPPVPNSNMASSSSSCYRIESFNSASSSSNIYIYIFSSFSSSIPNNKKAKFQALFFVYPFTWSVSL